MEKQVVFLPPFGKSARLLAREMGLEAVNKRVALTRGTAGVAWGCLVDSERYLNGRINANKLDQLNTWQDAGLSKIEHSERYHAGWFAREYTHYGGSDFDGRAVDAAYFTKPQESASEYRAHVFRYKGKRGNPANYMIGRLGWKVNVEAEKHIVREGCQIRSRKFGWRIKYYSNNNVQAFVTSNPKHSLLLRWAVASLGWDFAAVDYLADQDGKCYLLEANSAPGLLDENTRKCYATRLAVLL